MKQLVVTIMCLLCASTIWAQEVDIDETDLFGRWNLVESSGDFIPYSKYETSPKFSMQKPEALLFYDEPNIQVNDDSLGVAYYCDPHYPEYVYDENTWQKKPTGNYVEYWEYVGIRDYWISKNNKLHILMRGSHYALRYKIIGFDGDKLTLETMNGKGTVIYMRDGSTGVSEVRRQADNVEYRYYSLDGKLLDGEPQNGAFIKGRKKYLKR